VKGEKRSEHSKAKGRGKEDVRHFAEREKGEELPLENNAPLLPSFSPSRKEGKRLPARREKGKGRFPVSLSSADSFSTKG